MATSDLTILLVPPPGDATLLADEAGGGRVPRMVQYVVAYGPGENRWRPSRTGKGSALLLALDGVPVAMGCDRAARALTARTIARVRREGTGMIRAFAPQLAYRIDRSPPPMPWGALDLCDAWAAEGSRIVLLRDGREVTE